MSLGLGPEEVKVDGREVALRRGLGGGGVEVEGEE